MARNATPVQRQEGAILLQRKQKKLNLSAVLFFYSKKLLDSLKSNLLSKYLKYLPNLMCTLSVGMMTEGYWLVVGGGVRPVLVGEASRG